ncbi:MAG: response regulator [Phycisphaerae bacterium]|nr:response regulator [Phycisphaerae bacterium]
MSLLPPNKGYVKGLRLSKEAEKALLAQMDRETNDFNGSNRRREDRPPYRPEEGLRIQLFHAEGVKANLQVIPRNISRNGLAFLHGSYVHLGTKCITLLQTLDGRLLEVRGEVIRCTHYRGNVHEVAVQYDSTIDLEDFVQAYLTDAERHGSGNQLVSLTGRILYLEDVPEDRELVAFLLRRHGLDVRTACNPSEVFDLLGFSAFDLAIVDLHLPGLMGPEVPRALRDRGFVGPMIGVTASESEAIHKAVMAEGCAAVLVKPYAFSELLSLLKTNLPGSGQDEDHLEPLHSALWSDVAMRPLILRFLDRLDEKSRQLRRLMEAEDRNRIQQLCSELKGSAKGYGYSQISRAAREIQKLATDGAPFDRLESDVTQLAKLCTAACMVRKR